MKLIDKLHSMADEAVENMQWPFRKRAIARAFDSVIDSAESTRLRVDAQIVEAQRDLTKVSSEDEAKEIIEQIDDLRIELEEAERLSARVSEEKAALFEKEAE